MGEAFGIRHSAFGSRGWPMSPRASVATDRSSTQLPPALIECRIPNPESRSPHTHARIRTTTRGSTAPARAYPSFTGLGTRTGICPTHSLGVASKRASKPV